MKTPPLGLTLVRTQILVVTLVVLAFDIVVYLAVRAHLGGTDPLAATGPTLRELLRVLALGSLAAIATTALLTTRAVRLGLRPLTQISAAAQRASRGVTGERLRPDDAETELGQLAAAYDELLDNLELAVAEAQESDELSQRFLADAAHQLRTPLATIRAGVELLAIDPDPEQRESHLTTLIRETSRASRVLNSLMTLARLDRGRPMQREPTDLVELCQSEVERALGMSPTLLIQCEAEGPAVAVVDGDEIREVVANLLDNARRHAASSIVVRVEAGSEGIVVRVSDDGPGVPDEAVNLVFERFATLDGRGGSGLGLPIARAIAQSHGGELTYDGDFVLVLPRSGAPAS